MDERLKRSTEDKLSALRIFLKDYNVNLSPAGLYQFFHDDSIRFKQFLKLLFDYKIKCVIGDVALRPFSISFPRKGRKEQISELERETRLTFPKTSLSIDRIKILILSVLLPAFGLVIFLVKDFEFILVSIGNGGLVLYWILLFVPLMLINMVWPSFFKPLDWSGIKNYDDLLWQLVMSNYIQYTEDDFLRSINEVMSLRLSEESDLH